MPSLEKSRIVVLHLTKFSDHGVVVHALDSLRGRCSFLLRGLKKGGDVAAFHPLSVLDVVSGTSPKSTMAYLKEWEPVQRMHGIRGDMVKGSVAMFLSEVLYRSFTAEIADEALFEWVCDAASALDQADGSVANFHLWFLVSYAVRLGYMPGEAIEPSGIFSEEETRLFYRILESRFEDTLSIPLSASRRQGFTRHILQYLSWHLGATIDAKSLDVLHEVLS